MNRYRVHLVAEAIVNFSKDVQAESEIEAKYKFKDILDSWRATPRRKLPHISIVEVPLFPDDYQLKDIDVEKDQDLTSLEWIISDLDRID